MTIYRRGQLPAAEAEGDSNFHWGFMVTQDGLTESTGGGTHIAGLHSANARNALSSIPNTLHQFAKDHFGVYVVQYTPGVWDWTGAIRGGDPVGHMPDDTIDLIDTFRHATSPGLMMQAYGIPGWQHGDAIGDDFDAVAPSTEAFEDDYAEDCALYADRFDGTGGQPLLTHMSVWNEMKGLDASGMNTAERTKYIRMYNKVWAAVKAVRPDMLIGGPYVKWLSFGSTSTGNPSSDNGLAACTFTGGVIHNHVLDLHYEFERDADGYDYIATDIWAGNDYHNATPYSIHTGVTAHDQAMSKFDVCTARMRAMHPNAAGKPIIFNEFYTQGAISNYNGSDTWTESNVEDWVVEVLQMLTDNGYGPGWLCAWGENAEPPRPFNYDTGVATTLISKLIAYEAGL
jgi:hypothetical protein